jgi:hypothetical protein
LLAEGLRQPSSDSRLAGAHEAGQDNAHFRPETCIAFPWSGSSTARRRLILFRCIAVLPEFLG